MDPNFAKVGLLILGASVAAGASGAITYKWLAAPSTVNECILLEMRGRPREMIGLVRNVCAARFPAKLTPVTDPVILQELNR